MNRIAEAFTAAGRENRAVFIPFLMAGDPSGPDTVVLAGILERAGAGILELGIPFSDPIADGPVLQRSAVRALSAGITLAGVFDIARRIRESTRMALVLFSYINPLLRHGIRRTAFQARQAGFDGVLVTDLPPEEADICRPALREVGLDTIFLASPTSTPSRMSAAAGLSSGFLYVVSRPGTTGTRQGLPPDLPATVERARRAAGSLPVAIGFGISTERDAREAALLADGVVVGSAIVRAIEEGGSERDSRVGELAGKLARACRRKTSRSSRA